MKNYLWTPMAGMLIETWVKHEVIIVYQVIMKRRQKAAFKKHRQTAAFNEFKLYFVDEQWQKTIEKSTSLATDHIRG